MRIDLRLNCGENRAAKRSGLEELFGVIIHSDHVIRAEVPSATVVAAIDLVRKMTPSHLAMAKPYHRLEAKLRAAFQIERLAS